MATICRWLGKFEIYGTVSSLANSFHNCGGKGKSCLKNSVVDVVLNEMFLNKQQYPLSVIYMKIDEKCKNLKLKTPHIDTIRNKIKNGKSSIIFNIL